MMAKMKKVSWFAVFIISISLVMFFSSDGFSAVPSDAKNEALYEALGEGFGSVFEEASGIPASGISQMVGYFSAGDFRNGFLKAAEIVTDTAIGMIPVVGPAKFVVGLETAVIKAGKAYLDGYMIDIFWGVFKGLSPVDQDNWLNGGYEPLIQDGLGGYYTERNAGDLRDLFKFYRDHEQKKQEYMKKAAQVIGDLNKAKYFYEANLVKPLNREVLPYNSGITLYWGANLANFFQVVLKVDGKSFGANVKIKPEEPTSVPGITLGEFGVNWQEILEGATSPVTVEWMVKSARYDSSGLIEQLVGSDYLFGPNKLVKLPDSDPIKDSEWGTFQLAPTLSVSIVSPENGTKVSENQVKVNAAINISDGSTLDIQAVGFIINGSVQYATLSGNSFSTVAVLKTGDNKIQAGVVMKDGNAYLSQEITVTSTALNNTYHIRIVWDKDDTDVDLYFSWSGGNECYFGNSTPDWGGRPETSPRLDVDDTDGFGPENITIGSLPRRGNSHLHIN